MKVTVTINRAAPITTSGRALDEFTFLEDGGFTDLSGVPGTWQQNDRSFHVDLDDDEIVSLFYQIAESYGVDVLSVSMLKAEIDGRESNNGNRITGVLKLKIRGLGVNVRGGSASLKVNSTSQFTGERITEASANVSIASWQNTDLLKHVLRSVTEAAAAAEH